MSFENISQNFIKSHLKKLPYLTDFSPQLMACMQSLVKKSMSVYYRLTVPIFAAEPNFFFHYSLGVLREFPVWLYYPHIKSFNKIKTFSDLPTLFNFSMQK